MKRLLLSLLLIPGAALAHHGERHPPANAMAQAAPARPDAAIQELQRQRANPDVPPGVQAQRRDAEEVDEAGIDDALGQVQAARTALRARRAGQANEFLERAESRLLTRTTLVQNAGRPVQGGPIGHISAARAALLRNDSATAMAEIDRAIAMLERRGRPAR
ncbi:MAG: hypothetical protein K2X11_13020 [Acetobacteraceae bacterium]|nr:hypothetical protein [Acetobacteraceae bacterium]